MSLGWRPTTAPPSATRSPRLGAALLWLATLLVSAPGQAQEAEVASRVMSIERNKEALRLSFDAREFADGTVLHKLKSGLPQTLVLRVVAYDERGRTALAATAQSCRVVYDLWEGGYRVQLERPGRSQDVLATDARKVVETCLQLRKVKLSGDGFTAGKRVYCAVLVEFNPMSEATVKRIRRWLSRPSAGQLRGDAFFGSFVSIFVGRDLGAAERSAAYRSQVWVVPP